MPQHAHGDDHAAGENKRTSTKHLVILVHGIRDIARWQSEIRRTLEAEGFVVAPTNYGRMNLIEFLLPFPYFRNKAKAEVWLQILHARLIHPDASRVSIIAHSFGTYLVAAILREQFILRIHRVIFCGSVVRFNFPWEQIEGRYEWPVMNDVGTADPWPAIAESVTTGYGSTGTYGFNRPPVLDRYHNDKDHSYFLNADFCRKYWIPFLLDGTAFFNENADKLPRAWVRLISIVKAKYILAVAACVLVLMFGARETYLSDPAGEVHFQAKYAHWRDALKSTVDAAGTVCHLPLGLCDSPRATNFLTGRRYIRFSTVDGELFDTVSCGEFNFVSKRADGSIVRDPVAKLDAWIAAFPRCIELREDQTGTMQQLVALKQHMTLVNRPGQRPEYLCGCSDTQITQFMKGE